MSFTCHSTFFYLDLSSRRWSKLTQTHDFDIMDISDAVVNMFEYQ